MRHLGEKFGIEYIHFPSKTQISYENDAKNMSNKLTSDPNYPEYVEPAF